MINMNAQKGIFCCVKLKVYIVKYRKIVYNINVVKLMENMITINNLNFKYRDKVIFSGLSLEIENNKITSIIGCNGSGKSTLVKILLGLLKFNGTIKIGNKMLVKDNIKEIRKQIGVVFENPDNQFVAETVMDDIAFTLENMNVEKKEIKNKIEEIAKYIGIYDILEKNPYDLSGGQKQLVALASAIIHEPKLLILDEALTMIEPCLKDKIAELLLDLKSKGMTIILVTHDIEETTFGDNIIVLNDGKIDLKGIKEEVYQAEKKLHDLGFKLPFMVELSYRLMFYNLIDHIIYNMEEMVDTLWK